MSEKKAPPSASKNDVEKERVKSANASDDPMSPVGKTGGKQPGDVPCKCQSQSQMSNTLSSRSSLSSTTSAWSFEQLAHAKSCERNPVPYSENTKRQIELIKTLVEEQEKETAARLAREAAGETEGKDSGREPESEVSTTFGQAMDWIHDQIRIAHEEKDRKRESKKSKKKKEESGKDK